MRFLILLAAVLVALPAAHGQPFNVRDLDARFDSEPRVEVNLRGSLLRLAAEAARAEEPETALMLDGLNAVTVRIYATPPESRAFAVQQLSDVGRMFEDAGWYTLVRVRSLPGSDDDDGDVWVYILDDGDAFNGLAVLALDDEDGNAVVVHIDGRIDPTQVSELSRRFARIDLDDVTHDDE